MVKRDLRRCAIKEPIPEIVILRLPLYARTLSHLAREGVEVISSRDLGGRLGITPAQIRKDFSYFGRFGRQGKGYNVTGLLSELRRILGLDREWSLAVVGMGRLGQAVVRYGGFGPQGFRVVATFDQDPRRIGQKVRETVVQNIAELGRTIRERSIDIGIVAVPAEEAQRVIDTLVESGVKAILNYAPIAARVPADVKLRVVDPVVALQSMTFYLKSRQPTRVSDKNQTRERCPR